uniref:Uncharacterized protein n=1 Tax=Cacopsylla melanoneura TaxID=428564 RepID=A0A8D8VP09_9HEMI
MLLSPDFTGFQPGLISCTDCMASRYYSLLSNVWVKKFLSKVNFDNSVFPPSFCRRRGPRDDATLRRELEIRHRQFFCLPNNHHTLNVLEAILSEHKHVYTVRTPRYTQFTHIIIYTLR